MIAIVESRADDASTHICSALRAERNWEIREDDSLPDAEGGGTYYRSDGFELRSFERSHLELVSPIEAFESDPNLLVFASKHAGDTGPLLTGHATGNFGPAEYGGEDHALAEPAPNALDRLLDAFHEHAPEGYDVGMECTHHGPSAVGCPSLFAELGSAEPQWNDADGARAVARAILDLEGVAPHAERVDPRGVRFASSPSSASDEIPPDRSSDRSNHATAPRRQIVGFGGNHYVPRYQRIVEDTTWSVGHVASEWALEAMGDPWDHRDVIDTAFETGRTEFALLEGTYSSLEAVIDELGYTIVTETWLREVGDRPLALVAAVESELGPIEDGVRFGDRQPTEGALLEDDDPFAIVDLPDELIDVAEGVDPDRVRETIEATAIAFETENGGSRVGTRAAFPEAAIPSELIEAFVDILEIKYESVRLEDDAIVVEERAFDPSLAAEAGVPEGPKFGALAGGSSVTVDGERVDPEDVSVQRTRRFRTRCR